MRKYFIAATLIMLAACKGSENKPAGISGATAKKETLHYPQEKHLKNIRQLTFGGDNAEAYFSFDNKHLVFQRTTRDEEIPCDQIFTIDLIKPKFKSYNLGELYIPDPNNPFPLISTGKGRTTCAYFLPGNDRIIYASTHLADAACPEEPDRTKIKKYVWPIYNSYELFIADTAGNQLKQLTSNNFYDAEATVSPKGDKIVFTSNRSGDLELYTMNIDGSDVRQVTTGLGYDGGAFFSPDGSQLIFRASRPKTAEEQQEYKELLAQGLVAPTNMELYVCNVDGSELRQITNLGKANWAPFFHPSGKKIIFSSNHASETGRLFNLYMINLDGTGLKQITFDQEFDSFPMFSFDGKHLVFASNRNNGDTRDTNVFIAEWVD